MKKHLVCFFAFLLMFSCSTNVLWSAENDTLKENKKKIEKKESKSKDYRMSPVVVKEEKSGEINIDREELEMLPSPGDSITGALRGKSSIQFDSMSRDSFAGGAITPPKVSIRGAHHYENNFTINGMSNNNIMNPGGFNEKTAFGSKDITGDSQSMFISTELLESVTAYTENISAAYGDFLGGVVDAKYRDAAEDRWHVMVRGRHTRDQWANQHYFEKNEPSANPSSQSGQHSRFEKTSASAIVEGPIFDNLGIIMAYDRKWSDIPTFMNYGNSTDNKYEEHKDHRLNENYFIRLNTKLTDDFKAALTATYAPYSAKMHPPAQKDGEYELQGGGYSLGLETQWELPYGTWENSFSYSSTEVSKDSNSDTMYQWLTRPSGNPSKYANWSYKKKASEGMMGDVENKQDAYELKSLFRAEEFATASLRHHILTGFDVKLLRAKADHSGYSSWLSPKVSAAVVGTKEDGAIAGEQYCGMKINYLPYSRSKGYKTGALFLEDSIDVERVLVRPGLRISWDDITKDINFAPRLFANVDLLNDKRFNVFGGYNRYYGSQILKRALTCPTLRTTEFRKLDAGNRPYTWKTNPAKSKDNDELGSLKTPYTDEYTLGASANVMDTFFKLTFVDRRYKDQLRIHTIYSTPPKISHYETVNDGKSKYWGITLEIEKEFDLGTLGEHRCEFAVTQSSTKSNYANWLDGFDQSDTSDDSSYVELDGEFVAKDKLPVGNFAAPLVLTYTQEMRFWEGKFRVMPVVRYETGGKTIQQVTAGVAYPVAPDGKKTKRYETKNRRDMVNVDLSLALDVLDYKDNVLTLEMDITNLFDRVNVIDVNSAKPSCGMGRQFYAGLKYTF